MLYRPSGGPLYLHHIRCTTHLGRLKDGFNNARPINKVLAKAASIVAYVRHSTHASDIQEGEARMQAENATRWNS